MAKSLLAHLYPHIKGSQEDIATLSLHYLLSQSNALNKSFTKKLSDVLEIESDETLQYLTQDTGEQNERPDMSGTDVLGKEVVLCEMKFYAGLTENQPLGYIDRLKRNGGKGLLFICPKSRKLTLWFELKRLCEDNKREIEIINSESCIKVDGVNMAIATWSDIIENIMNTAEASVEHLLSDIKQLKGYCEQIDSEAFIPFRPEELTAINARKAERFYTIIDKVSDLILTDRSLRFVKNSTKAGNRDGYISYLFVNDYAISIVYDRAFWDDDTAIDTPFWLCIKRDVGEKWWKQTDDIVEQMKKYPDNIKIKWNSAIYLALRVPTYLTEDEVCKDIKNQILTYINEVDQGINERKN